MRQPISRPARTASRDQRLGEAEPVDAVDHVGVGGHGPGLVGLKLADEVPGQRQIGAFGGLDGGLLVAVLPHVGDAEPGQEADVGGGVGLGDRDERDLGAGPALRRRTRR